jgi:hypothetical protein
LANPALRPRLFALVGTRGFIFCSLAGDDDNPKDLPELIHSVQTCCQWHLSAGLERLPSQPAVGALECAVHIIIRKTCDDRSLLPVRRYRRISGRPFMRREEQPQQQGEYRRAVDRQPPRAKRDRKQNDEQPPAPPPTLLRGSWVDAACFCRNFHYQVPISPTTYT